MSAGLDGLGVMYESATPYDGAALCLKTNPRSKVANKKQVGLGVDFAFDSRCAHGVARAATQLMPRIG